MRVCLVTPPSDFLLDQRVFMSLGILKIGAVLERNGFDVDHLDLTGVSNYTEAASDYSAGNVFAVTATTPQIPAAIKIRRVLRGKVILGGPHATLVAAAAKKGNKRAIEALGKLLEVFDCVVAGDGEKAIFRALNEYGFIDADDPSSSLWESSKDFTESPWPARHLVDVSSYRYQIDGEKALSMISQLGCPFECGFCGGRLSPMLRRIRTRPTESVISEMMHLHDTYGVTGIMFYDDELNVNPKMLSLMHSIKETRIPWSLRGFVKAELFTYQQAEAMYKAGFRWLLCGFESAHPRILRNINKKATLEDNTRMLRMAHEAGLKVKGLMSFGHPGESEETIYATRDWLLAEKPDDFDCTVITVYPGTPYYDGAVQVEDSVYKYEFHGDTLYSEDVDFSTEEAYYKGRSGDYKAFVWTDHLSRERLAELRDEVEEEVRTKLGIPYPSAAAALNYEHSVGMTLPPHILKGRHESKLNHAGTQPSQTHQAGSFYNRTS
jgi:anaerobic magnesium-protoporphyrin IX monomethyl ester cyclase